MSLPSSMTSGGLAPARTGFRFGLVPGDHSFWVEVQASTSTGFASSRTYKAKYPPSAANLALIPLETPYSTKTYYARARHYKVGYSTGAWSTLASGKPDYFVETQVDPAMYAHHVSRFGVLTTAATKTAIIHASNVLPATSTTPYQVSGAYIFHNAAGVTRTFYGPFTLAPGVTITKFTIHGFRAKAADVVQVILQKTSGAGIVSNVVTVNQTTTGWVTTTGSLAHVVSSAYTYYGNVTLQGTTVASNGKFSWARVTYTMPSLDKAY